MRILTVVFRLGPGGTERVAGNYSIAYMKAGVEAGVLAYLERGPGASDLEAHGIPVFAGDGSRQGAMAAAREAAAWGPDVIHIHRSGRRHQISAELVKQIRAEQGRRTPVMETNVFGLPDYSRDRHAFDVHLLVSRWCLWEWQLWHRSTSSEEVGLLAPNALRTERFYPATAAQTLAFRNSVGVPAGALLYGRIGQASAAKWSGQIVRSFESVARTDPAAYLLLVGAPGVILKALERLPTDIAGRVVTVPFIEGDDALRVAYSAIDVFLHSARIGESFGMVIAEALLCETPVLTMSTPTRNNAQVELVAPPCGGLVATSGSEFTEGMRVLAGSASTRAEHGRCGRRYVLRDYGADTVARRLIEVANLLARGLRGNDLVDACFASTWTDGPSWGSVRIGEDAIDPEAAGLTPMKRFLASATHTRAWYELKALVSLLLRRRHRF